MQESRHSEHHYRETSQFLLAALSPQGVFVSFSDELAGASEWDESDWVGKLIHSFLHPEDLTRVRKSFDLLLRGQSASLGYVRCIAKSGAYLSARVTLVPHIE